MKPFRTILALAAAILLTASCTHRSDGHLVILHTNDTHSAIEPDRHDKGGIIRRKVLIDSIRACRPNVMLIDAGDAVQGSLYYTLFDGEVERKMMNALGYDIQILGNHEFDKGMDLLAREWSQLNATRLATNYDLTGTTLKDLFVTSEIRQIDGHRIGFIGLNLDPEGLVVAEKSEGVRYTDAIEAANAEAARLKNINGAEIVIAVTHIGYSSSHRDCDDLRLAACSKDIDVIIGGHSHTRIDPADPTTPPSKVANAAGDSVTIVQSGGSGTYLGEIDIDLNNRTATSRLISVDNRLDNRLDSTLVAQLQPYKEAVSQMLATQIGTSPHDYPRSQTGLLNLMSDFVRMAGTDICGKPVDLAIMNKGGLRTDLPKGPITKGGIIDIAPFDNSIVVIDISGADLLDNFAIMAAQHGNGVSANVKALFDPQTCELNSVTIDNRPIDPKRTYRLATIDYLAAGNDYMTPLQKGTLVAKSPKILNATLIDYISQGRLDTLLSTPDLSHRMDSK